MRHAMMKEERHVVAMEHAMMEEERHAIALEHAMMKEERRTNQATGRADEGGTTCD